MTNENHSKDESESVPEVMKKTIEGQKDAIEEFKEGLESEDECDNTENKSDDS